MKIYSKIFLVILITLLLGCSSTNDSKLPKDIRFEGKGQNWEAELSFKYFDSFTPLANGKGKFKTRIYEHYIIKMIESEKEKIKDIEYNITDQSGNSKISGTREVPKDHKEPFVITGSGGSGGESEIEEKNIEIYRGTGFPQKEEKFILVIKWNGKSEKIILTNK